MRFLNLGCITIILLAFVTFFSIDYPPQDVSASTHDVASNQSVNYPLNPYKESVVESSNKVSFLFVGDLMLGRHVEKLSLLYGFEYPYKNISTMLQSADYTVGNFEGTVPSKHKPTEAYTLQFSFADDAFHQAAVSGFDILSLANNHSDDFGIDGYENTKNLCSLYEIVCTGHPSAVGEESVSYLHSNNETIAMISIDGTDKLSTTSIQKLLTQVERKSDLQFVYIHWGDEYKLYNNHIQQTLAHFFIDNGVDLVIGHHPHVVQNLEIYRGKLVVYSLGNFVFDQYFSDDVQTGLMLGLEIAENHIQVTLFGIESIDSPSSPKLLSDDKEKKMFKRIFDPIDRYDGVDVENGHIVIKR